MPTMPNVVGQLLPEAQALLEAAGVLDPAALGYFGTWPIALTWIAAANALSADATDVTADSLLGCDGDAAAFRPFTVRGQSIEEGDSTSANAPLTLQVVTPPLGVAYPAQNWSAF